MKRFSRVFALLSTLALTGAACAPAYADRIAAAPPAQIAAEEPVESPYQVELLGEDGRPLRTYHHRGRYYVRGQAGERYTVRVTNPTARRVEAVLSIDGLDAIDGRPADFVRKRGYVVPAYGELRVDGFRISTSQVATFRFSSVADSYAGRKGKDRNVGVIGVAIFEERAAQEVIVPDQPPVRPHPRPHPRHYQESSKQSNERFDDAEAGADAPAATGRTRAPARTSTARRSPAPPPASGSAGATAPRPNDSTCCTKTERPGLGTEFGEQRHSAVSWTRFERANPKTPTALATLRYNDAAGLRALGIRIEPSPDRQELLTRETADPFPGSPFAEPPPR